MAEDQRRARHDIFYIDGADVTPADGADLARFADALWVGGAGNINVDFVSGTTILLSGVAAGTLLRMRVKRVRATSTTATLIKALFLTSG